MMYSTKKKYNANFVLLQRVVHGYNQDIVNQVLLEGGLCAKVKYGKPLLIK